MENDANRDFLTGAWSRRAFFEFAERELALLRQSHGSLLLLVMDVNHFKFIHDRWGHAAGDETLIDVVVTAGSVTRNTDYFTRISGEEFAALLPDTDLAGALYITERLRSALDTAASTAPISDAKVRYTVSMGVTVM